MESLAKRSEREQPGKEPNLRGERKGGSHVEDAEWQVRRRWQGEARRGPGSGPLSHQTRDPLNEMRVAAERGKTPKRT